MIEKKWKREKNSGVIGKYRLRIELIFARTLLVKYDENPESFSFPIGFCISYVNLFYQHHNSKTEIPPYVSTQLILSNYLHTFLDASHQRTYTYVQRYAIKHKLISER